MIKKNFEISLDSLIFNPVRSFLTISGIVIGIAAVVAVLSIGKGHQEKIEKQIQQMGSDLFWIDIIHQPMYGGNIQRQFQGRVQIFFSQSSLTYSDADAIRNYCTAVQWSAPIVTYFTAGMINGKIEQFNVTATTPDYIKVKSLTLLRGRFFTYLDLYNLNNVCIIEERPGLNMYLSEKNYIIINSIKFEIIGEVKRQTFQPTLLSTTTIYLPISIVHLGNLSSCRINSIYCLAKDKLLDNAKEQVSQLLASRKHGNNNFAVRSSQDLFNTNEKLTQTATMVTAGIGMISLFVGGIGIMNILLASVFERIKEIGIRRSVGANKRDILLQFLFESIVVSLLGGIIGVIVGMLVTRILSVTINIPPVFSFEAILLGLIFSTMIGLLFGIYPAWKAANLDPIESLRYE